MDFPRSVPSIGLVDGKFIDEDAVSGTPGSLIPSAWGNAVTLEILKVIQEAGLDPDEDDNTQLNAAIDQKITESSVAFASQPEAETGESATKVMSPLRVFQAIAKVVTQATESAFGWVKIASPQQIAAGTNDAAAVTPKKLATAVQAQAFTAFSTSGTATALTLTPSPAIDGYEANQSFRIKFSLASGVNPTLNVSGKGPKALKQYDATGAKVAAVFAANQLSQVEYDGVDFILLDQLPSGSIDAGLVGYFARNTAPTGWLKANGSLVSRTTYASLFAAIGTNFGAGDGSTTFQLPELRGEFVRGWDDGRGVNAGRIFATPEAGMIEAHDHGITGALGSPSGVTSGNPNTWTGTGAWKTGPSGGSETRPRNVSLLACIKI